ncbi:gluconokinase [Candidatus Nitrospira salsa]
MKIRSSPFNSSVQILIIMGVSGSGKTTIGTLLAKDLGWSFYEGDNFHSQKNIDKMTRGIALTDEDREPWLHALRLLIEKLVATSEHAVISCSALKQGYRDILAANSPRIGFVYLKGSDSLVRERLSKREMHFMNEVLLESQLHELEEPDDALILDPAFPPQFLISQIKKNLEF